MEAAARGNGYAPVRGLSLMMMMMMMIGVLAFWQVVLISEDDDDAAGPQDRLDAAGDVQLLHGASTTQPARRPGDESNRRRVPQPSANVSVTHQLLYHRLVPGSYTSTNTSPVIPSTSSRQFLFNSFISAEEVLFSQHSMCLCLSACVLLLLKVK